MINFNIPPYTGKEQKYIKEAIKDNKKLSGDGPFTKKCNSWIEDKFSTKKALLTTSCTHSLEMSAILINIKPGEEVIMPSYTFVSTASAFVLRGAKIVFVDIRPDTMNIDENLIEKAITKKTKAIVPVHYAGVSCEMDKIMKIAKKYNLFVIEDAAQGVMSTYKNKSLGSIGDIGCFSFHETKNYTMGEGGAILINNKDFIERTEIIREKGTNRSKFFRGQVDKYTWVDMGSSFLPNELTAAFLYAQLEKAEEITNSRLKIWNQYHINLKTLEEKSILKCPHVPNNCTHNAHMYYVLLSDKENFIEFIKAMKEVDICCVSHYVPLHSSPAGTKFGRTNGNLDNTNEICKKLVRLPLWTGIETVAIDDITKEFSKVASRIFCDKRF